MGPEPGREQDTEAPEPEIVRGTVRTCRHEGVIGFCGYRIRYQHPRQLLLLPSLTVRVALILNGVSLRVADPTAVRLSWAESPALALGVQTRAVVAAIDRDLTCLQILLAPWAAFRVFGVPACDLSGIAADLSKTADGEAMLPGVVSRLSAAATWQQRFAIADRVLARRCAAGPPAAPIVREALDTLRRTGGRISVRALATECGCSKRLLEKRFNEQVGTSPKSAARVARLRRAAVLLSRGQEAGTVASVCGYCDQAHLTREFTAMLGVSPGQFARARRVVGGVEHACVFLQDDRARP